MYFISFIVALAAFLLAAIIFGRGLVKMHQNSGKARGFISSGFMIGLLGVIAAAVIFGFFNL
jgi:hypothetical protein